MPRGAREPRRRCAARPPTPVPCVATATARRRSRSTGRSTGRFPGARRRPERPAPCTSAGRRPRCLQATSTRRRPARAPVHAARAAVDRRSLARSGGQAHRLGLHARSALRRLGDASATATWRAWRRRWSASPPDFASGSSLATSSVPPTCSAATPTCSAEMWGEAATPSTRSSSARAVAGPLPHARARPVPGQRRDLPGRSGARRAGPRRRPPRARRGARQRRAGARRRER